MLAERDADQAARMRFPTIAEGEVRPCAKLNARPAMAPATTMTASNRSFLSSLAFMPPPPRCRRTIHGLRPDWRTACDDRYSMNVVSCAPSSATNTAISSAGSVLLAFAETRCVAPGGSKNDCPTLKVSTGPPAELRADFALGDIGGDRAGVPMRAGKSAGAVEHPHDRHALARHVRQARRRRSARPCRAPSPPDR